jgi:hypothetical protein
VAAEVSSEPVPTEVRRVNSLFVEKTGQLYSTCASIPAIQSWKVTLVRSLEVGNCVTNSIGDSVELEEESFGSSSRLNLQYYLQDYLKTLAN